MITTSCKVIGIISFLILLFIPVSQAIALFPDEILVVANRNYSKSLDVAHYYLKKRGIPKENLLRVWTVRTEWITRDRFERDLKRPIRRFIEDKRQNIKCILLVYGIPLKIIPSKVKKRRIHSPRQGENITKGQKGVTTTTASVDSELSLCLEDHYELKGWLLNPNFIGFKAKNKEGSSPKHALYVSRIDGPTPEIATRIIDDALYAERHGLRGVAYFDARYPPPTKKKVFKDMGYGYYDWSIYAAAEIVRASGLLKVIVDKKSSVFRPGACPNAALYCGWYSLGHYVDAFTWKRGAIGYHIASSECTTLKNKGSQVWCKRMLEDGVSVTLGPVREPYIQAFPIPHIFCGLLVNTNLTIAECYWKSIPFVSWQMVLIGDPLYRPFLARTEGIH